MITRLKNKINSIRNKNYQKKRINVARRLSSCEKILGNPIINQPTYFMGRGEIQFGENVNLGFAPSPYFFDGSAYLEVREPSAKIHFGNNITVNNNLKIICEKTEVVIEDMVLIGTNVEILDSDFHEIDPNNRCSGKHEGKPVIIRENAFIGSNVKICKGVEIGKNSIIANGSIVFNSIPDNVIALGNPATVLKKIT